MSLDLHEYTAPESHSRRHVAKPSVLRKLIWFVAGIAAGLLLGAIGGFVQADRYHLKTSTIPYGVVLSLLMFVLAAVYAAREYQSRWPAIGMVIGWVLGTILMAVESNTGDLAIAVSNRATGYLIAGSVLGGLVAAMPPLRRFVPQPFASDESEQAHSEDNESATN